MILIQTQLYQGQISWLRCGVLAVFLLGAMLGGQLQAADTLPSADEVIQKYLPKALSETEISALVTAAIRESGASSIKDMGKVMGQLKPKMQGRADMAAVSALVKQQLVG